MRTTTWQADRQASKQASKQTSTQATSEATENAPNGRPQDEGKKKLPQKILSSTTVLTACQRAGLFWVSWMSARLMHVKRGRWSQCCHAASAHRHSPSDDGLSTERRRLRGQSSRGRPESRFGSFAWAGGWCCPPRSLPDLPVTSAALRCTALYVPQRSRVRLAMAMAMAMRWVVGGGDEWWPRLRLYSLIHSLGRLPRARTCCICCICCFGKYCALVVMD